MIFIKVIVSIILIIGVINPRLSWKISEGWKFRDVEPSTLYLIMTRVMSVVMLIVVWLAIPN
ncbi:DUF6199 family natural product biosynthesis protein [Clostridium sp. YIM B02551]|uniref:DUF6199 family natural product biosynthesis protein n=1 Tax=Clostridium sp. YIM B02551 TaxID=2910679 RepID=UPI001EEB18EB|nr:DUF6199 family natural product biosynthesis protein [Clostridium sp. YIM B02551]